MLMTIREFEAKLSNGIVRFTFRKRNGELRKAVGTRQYSIVHDKVSGGEGPAGTIPFWDMEIKEWRSVRPDTIISIEA